MDDEDVGCIVLIIAFVVIIAVALLFMATYKAPPRDYTTVTKWPYAENCVEVRDKIEQIAAGVYCLVDVGKK